MTLEPQDPHDDGVPPLHVAPVVGALGADGSLVVRLAGELDLYSAEAVREALRQAAEQAPERVVVDLSEVSFIDSTTLGVLVEARSRFASRDCFRLAAPGAETRRTLEVSGLDRHFSVHPTVDEALETV